MACLSFCFYIFPGIALSLFVGNFLSPLKLPMMTNLGSTESFSFPDLVDVLDYTFPMVILPLSKSLLPLTVSSFHP